MTFLIDGAVEDGNYEYVKWFFENIRDEERKNSYASLALIRAIKKGHVDIAMFLTRLYPDLSQIAFRKAVSGKQEEIVIQLLEQGFRFKPSMYDVECLFSPLQEAVMCGYWNIAKLLIDNSTDEDMDLEGGIALKWAITNKNYEIAKLLLNRGATVEVQHPIYRTRTIMDSALVGDRKINEVFESLSGLKLQ